MALEKRIIKTTDPEFFWELVCNLNLNLCSFSVTNLNCT